MTWGRASRGFAGGAGLPLPPVSSGPAVITALAGGGTGWFTDQYGQPRLLLTDNPWALIPNAGRWGGTPDSDIDSYCNSRGSQGFTAAYLDPLGNTENNGAFADGRTWDGIYPFTVNGTAGSTASLSGTETIGLNSTFWARVDYFIAGCARNGMTAWINIAYEGPGDFATGGAYPDMTATQFGEYGTALAARYKTTQNIIWTVGNDYFGGDDTKFSAQLTALRAGGDTHLTSAHNYAESTSRFDIGTGTAGTQLPWGFGNAQFSMVYTYVQTYIGVEDAYAESSPIPVIWGDGWFYNSTGNSSPSYFGSSDRAARQYAWWALSSGARGLNTGSEGVWQWSSSAPGEVTTEYWYTSAAGKIRALLESLPNWYKLIPDTGSALVTAGRGTHGTETTSGGGGSQYGTATTDSYVTASRVPDGSLALIYLSHVSTITIDQTKMASGYTATWADPDSCVTYPGTAGGTYHSGSTDLTKPASNNRGDPDWVLILKGP